MVGPWSFCSQARHIPGSSISWFSPHCVIVTRYHLTYPQRKAFCSYSIWDTYYLNEVHPEQNHWKLLIEILKFELLTHYQKVLWSCWSSQSWTWSGVSVGPLCWPRTRHFRRNRFRPFRHCMQFQWVHPFRSLTSSRFRKDYWDRTPRSVRLKHQQWYVVRSSLANLFDACFATHDQVQHTGESTRIAPWFRLNCWLSLCVYHSCCQQRLAKRSCFISISM